MDEVRVYWNIRRRQFSVQEREPKGWRVSTHLGHYFAWYELSNVKFHVSETGRQRVLSSGRKNVHAWVEGTWERDYALAPFDPAKANRVRYDPYHDEFFNILGNRIEKAERLFFGIDYGRPKIYVD